MTDTIPPIPTTPIVVAPVVPSPTPDGWDRFGRDIASAGRWITGFTEVTIGGGCRKAGGAIPLAVGWVWSNLPQLAIIGLLIVVARAQGCALPDWVHPAPVPAPTALEASIRAAYLAETDPAKASHAVTLATVLAKIVPATRAAGNTKTVADLESTVHDATTNAVGADGLPAVRKAIGVYLNGIMPAAKSAPMTDQIWLQASAEYGRVSAALTKECK